MPDCVACVCSLGWIGELQYARAKRSCAPHQKALRAIAHAAPAPPAMLPSTCSAPAMVAWYL